MLTCHWCEHTGDDVSMYGALPMCDNTPECTKRMIENEKNRAINEAGLGQRIAPSGDCANKKGG